MRALVLLVPLFVSIAGCTECQLRPWGADWTDAALYYALSSPVGFSCDGDCQRDRPAFEFRHADLDARWSAYELYEVNWLPDIDPKTRTMLAAFNGSVVAIYPSIEALASARGDIVRFLENVTDASGSDVEPTIDAMAANQSSTDPAWIRFRADTPFEPTPLHVFQNLTTIATAIDPRVIGWSHDNTYVLEEHPWKFRFRLGDKRLDGDGFTLKTDALGRTHFEGLTDLYGEGDYKERIRAELAQRGLPAPDPNEIRVNGSIC